MPDPREIAGLTVSTPENPRAGRGVPIVPIRCLLMDTASHQPVRSGKPAVVSATAALAALSVALLLTMPAVTATGQTLRASSESEATRVALAQLRESLSEAARALAGVDRVAVQPAAMADRPTLGRTLQTQRVWVFRSDHEPASLLTPMRESLLNLPPPTR